MSGTGAQPAAGPGPEAPAAGPQSPPAGTGPEPPPAAPASQVPGWLVRAAGWSWRLLLVGIVIYLAFRVASVLRLVVLPCVAALLLTALLQPLLSRFRRLGLPALAATWCTLLIAVAILAGAGTLAVTRTTADYPHLVNELRHTVTALQTSLAGPPFHVRHAGIQSLSNRALKYLQQHQSLVAGTVVSGGKIFLEILAGLVLMLFVTFFLLKDGERIWGWLTGFLGPDSRRRVHLAGSAAWQALVYYVRGTIAVAAIHAIVIGFSLWVLGVPLLVPLVILVFLAAFVPLVGILVAGALAVGRHPRHQGLDRGGRPGGHLHPGEPAGEPSAAAARGRPDGAAAPAGHHPGAGHRRGGGGHPGSDRGGPHRGGPDPGRAVPAGQPDGGRVAGVSRRQHTLWPGAGQSAAPHQPQQALHQHILG